MQQLNFIFSAPKPAMHIWDSVCTFDNLLIAYKNARKGKRQRDTVAEFELNREQELYKLQQELQDLTYQPGQYRQFEIYDRKKRLISAAPFRDRVVHHAIMRHLMPKLEPLLYKHCYACRVGMGVHKAVDRYQYWSRRYAYVLKLDVQRYFPSINQQILLEQLKDVIDDKSLMQVLEKIVRQYHSHIPNTGMAIGNLTSQFFANWYLKGIDEYIINQGFSAYLRYVDDLFIFADNKATLWRLKFGIESQLIQLKLELHQHQAVICRTTEKVPVLGYQISRHKRWLQSANGKKAQRNIRHKITRIRTGHADIAQTTASIRAWVGHAQHAQTRGLRTAIFGCYTNEYNDEL